MAEAWIDAEEALLAGTSSEGGQKLGAALLEDEGNFIDPSRYSAFIVEESDFQADYPPRRSGRARPEASPVSSAS